MMHKPVSVKALSLILTMILVLTLACSASGESVMIEDVTTATDEELSEAIAIIKAEQQARIKTSVSVDPGEITLKNGGTVKITPTVIDLADGVEAGKQFVYETSDPAVATCSGGMVKALGPGTAVITVTNTLTDGVVVSGVCVVTVVVPVTSVSFEQKALEVMAGDELVPSILIKPVEATDQSVIYTSSDETILRVDEEGHIIGVAMGKARLTVAAADGSGKKATVNVTVTKRLGKYEGPITFQGIPWGSGRKDVKAALIDSGFAKSGGGGSAYFFLWPEDEKAFESEISGPTSPLLERYDNISDKDYITPQKKIGGYTMPSMALCYLYGIQGGAIDQEDTMLTAVMLHTDGSENDTTDMSVYLDLVAQLEATYGGLEHHINKRVPRTVDVKALKTAAVEYREFDERNMDVFAYALLHGEDGTAIMIRLTWTGVDLFYAKTDCREQVDALAEIASRLEDAVESTGL